MDAREAFSYTVGRRDIDTNHHVNNIHYLDFALEALPQVDAAQVSHTAGTAVVTLNAGVADDVLTQTVEAKDYKVTGIE